jgi:hypothetical protein
MSRSDSAEVESIRNHRVATLIGKGVDEQSSDPHNEARIKDNGLVFRNTSHGAGLDLDRGTSRSE